MKELSLNILDIAMNSVKAGAALVGIHITEQGSLLTIKITDDGCGMSEQTIKKLSDPFYTTRTTRKVGLGIPFFSLAAQQTGGSVTISSVEQPDPNHGTTVTAVFHTDHIDFTPLGAVSETLITLIQGYPEIDIDFTHTAGGNTVSLDTRQLKTVLDGVPINSFEILDWIKQYLTEQYQNFNI